MLHFLQVSVLSLLQGITEFLPISSSAHLIVISKLMAWEDQGLIFDVSLHIGTLASALFYFRKNILALFFDCGGYFFNKNNTLNNKLFFFCYIGHHTCRSFWFLF